MVRPENLRATRISAMRGLFLFWFIAALALSPSMVIALARRRTKCSGFEGRSILFFSPPSWGSKSIVMGIWRRKSYHGFMLLALRGGGDHEGAAPPPPSGQRRKLMPWEKSKGRKRLRRQHKVSPMEAQLVAGTGVPLEKAKQYSLEERERAYKGSLEDAWRNDKRPDPLFEFTGRWKDGPGLEALEYKERDALEEAMSIEFERSVMDREGLAQGLLTNAGSGVAGQRMVDEKGAYDDIGDNDDDDEFNVPSELMGQSSTPVEEEKIKEGKRSLSQRDVARRSRDEGGGEEAEKIQMRGEDEDEGEQDYSGGLKSGSDIKNDDGMFVYDFGSSSDEGDDGGGGQAGGNGEEQGDKDPFGSSFREGGAGHRRGVQEKGDRGCMGRHEARKGSHHDLLPSRSGSGFRRTSKSSMAMRQEDDAQESSVGSAEADYEHLKPPPLDEGWQRRPASDGGNEREQEKRGKGKLEVSYDASLAKDDDDWGDDPEMNEIQNILDEAGYDLDGKVGDSAEEGEGEGAEEEGVVSEGSGDGEEKVEYEFVKSGSSSQEEEEGRGGDGGAAGGEQVARFRDDEEDVSDWVKANPEVARFYGVKGIGNEESSSSGEERRLAIQAAKEAKQKKREWKQLRKVLRDNSGMGDFGDGEYDDDSEQQRGSESQQSDSSGDNKLGSLADGGVDKEFLKKYFPFKVGAKYTIPAPIMLALYAEKKRKEWEATPEYRLLGEPAAKVLPSWMKNTKITQEHVDFVDNVAKYPNGTWKLDLLRDMLRRDIDKIMNDAAEADDDSMPEDVVAKIQAMTEAIEVLDDDIENNYQPPRPNVTTGPVWVDGYNENQFGREINMDTGEFLDGKRFDWVPKIQLEYWAAIRRNQIKTQSDLDAWLEKGAIMDAHDPFFGRCTAMHWAAWRGHVDTCALLIKLGANVTARCSDGSTPLHMSAHWGHVKLSKLLVASGSDVWDRRWRDGMCAIDIAQHCTSKHCDRTRLIVWLRKQMGIENVSYTPLMPLSDPLSDVNEVSKDIESWIEEDFLAEEDREYFTIPPGPYEPPWIAQERHEAERKATMQDDQEEEEEQDDDSIADPGAENVADFLQKQRDRDAADEQRQAEAQHRKEEGIEEPPSESDWGEGFLSAEQSDAGSSGRVRAFRAQGSGAEYGHGGKHSRTMRGLGLDPGSGDSDESEGRGMGLHHVGTLDQSSNVDVDSMGGDDASI